MARWTGLSGLLEPMFLWYYADLPGRVPGDNREFLDILRDNRPRPNHGIPTDPYPRQYRGIGPDAGPLRDDEYEGTFPRIERAPGDGVGEGDDGVNAV